MEEPESNSHIHCKWLTISKSPLYQELSLKNSALDVPPAIYLLGGRGEHGFILGKEHSHIAEITT